MKVNYFDNEVDVKAVRTKYTANDTLAVVLLEAATNAPFANLTVNLTDSDFITEDDHAFVDTNNCPWAEEFIRNNQLGEFADMYGFSGFCMYPLYKFNLEKIPQNANDMFEKQLQSPMKDYIPRGSFNDFGDQDEDYLWGGL
jgi:hypothetical protein